MKGPEIHKRSCSGWAEGVGVKGTPGGVSSEKVRKGIPSKMREKSMEIEEGVDIYMKSWKGLNQGYDFS